MAQLQPHGKVVLSIDLDRAEGGETSAQTELSAWLVHEVMKLGIRATWGVGDRSLSKLARSLTASGAHELGLVVTTPNSKRPLVRGHFEKWIDDRQSSARQNASTISVSLWQGAGRLEHLDVLSERGLDALRGARALPQPPVVWHKPRILRHGVWELPASMVLLPPSGWFGVMSQTRRVRGLLHQSAHEHAIAHFVADMAELSTRLSASQSLLRSVLKTIHTALQEGVVESHTVGSAVTAARSDRRPEPARSILRSDAA